jgi:hypothetical protein
MTVYTSTQSAPGFYEALGWTTLEKRTYCGDEVTVMACNLADRREA